MVVCVRCANLTQLLLWSSWLPLAPLHFSCLLLLLPAARQGTVDNGGYVMMWRTALGLVR